LLTETEVGSHPRVTSAKSDLGTRTIEVTGDFGDIDREVLAEELSKALVPHGYSLSATEIKAEKNWSEFKIAIPIALGFALLFFVLQKIGIVNLVNSSNVSFGTAFVIGIIASLSTCMAVVGGLVLSMSATFAKEGDRSVPQMLFHIGRLVAFFILGGVIGAIGAAFALNTTATFILGVIVGLVMLILGINLLDIWNVSKLLQPAMPKFLSRHALGVSRLNHRLTPLLVGVTTFFLPCGFTQSMQLYTLTTGSFIKGGLTMLFFALGTLPVLALLSFSSVNIKNSARSGVFFKTAGLVVIMFALLNLVGALVVVGLVPPILNF
jgi:sulfite exporter TauE/SafE